MTRRSPFRHRSVAGLLSMSIFLVIAVALAAGPRDERPSQATIGRVSHTTATEVDAARSVLVAGDGFQGIVRRLPTSLRFPFRHGEVVPGPLLRGDDSFSASPSATGIPFQRHDLTAGDAGGRSITWQGRVDPARRVTLRAWNGDAWEPLDSSRGRVDGLVGLTGALLARHVHGGVVPVMVTGHDPFADDIPNPVRPSFEDPGTYDVAIAHVTDTQYLSEGADESPTRHERRTWLRAYTDTMDWIATNAEERKIAYTAHTGDLMQNWRYRRDDRTKARREFAVASAAQRILDGAGLVNSVLPGNHDNQSGTDNGPGALFNDFFGPRRYTTLSRQPRWRAAQATYRPWRRGDNANSYVLFSAAGLDFVAVSLGFTVTRSEAAWADRVLGRYADRNAILLTHAYNSPSSRPDGRGGGSSFDGGRVRNIVVKPNPNVFLVLSGHEHGVNISLRRNLGRTGNHVVELLADYQFYEVPAGEVGLGRTRGRRTLLQMGSSFFRLLQLDVDRSEVSVDTYSPFLDDFGATEYDGRDRYDGTEDDFRIPVQLQNRSTSFVSDTLALGPSGDVSPRDR